MTVRADQAQAVLRLTRLSKRFPGVVANDNVSLEVYRGEVHCVLGENGAGKSTLVALLSGLHQPDSGTIEIDGTLTPLASPADSIAHGIGVVHQHPTFIPSFTVLENLMLSTRPGTFWLDRAQAVTRLAQLNRSLGTHIDADLPAGRLGLGVQQQLEVALAMSSAPKILILDEPTSMLTPHTATRLMNTLAQLKTDGVACILVSHKLHEVYAVADRVTVLRAGSVVGQITRAELRELNETQAKARILSLMFGPGQLNASEHAPDPAPPDAPVMLQLQHLSTTSASHTPALSQVNLDLRAGEVLGVAGIDGQGQQHLAEIIAGQRRPSSGRVLLAATDITKLGVKARGRLGVRYLTDDRLDEGTIGSFSVALNLLLKQLGERPFWKYWRINHAAVSAEAGRHIRDYQIRTPSAHARVDTLSGGNIQKVLLARELSRDPRVVVFHQPSHGLDAQTAYRVHALIRDFVRGGGAALLISSDLDELFTLAGRIVVLSAGRVVGEVSGHSAHARERVANLMVAQAADARTGSADDGSIGGGPGHTRSTQVLA